MYLRHTTVRKNGKTHRYWRLVRSVRVGRKVRQETVTVRVGAVRVERGRRFGDVWLGWWLWRALGLDDLLGRLLPCGATAATAGPTASKCASAWW